MVDDTAGGAGGWGSGRRSGWWLLADGTAMKVAGARVEAVRLVTEWQVHEVSWVIVAVAVAGAAEADASRGEREAEGQQREGGGEEEEVDEEGEEGFAGW